MGNVEGMGDSTGACRVLVEGRKEIKKEFTWKEIIQM